MDLRGNALSEFQGEGFVQFWLNTLISQESLEDYLEGKSPLFSLTFTSHRISRVVRQYIERTYWFRRLLTNYILDDEQSLDYGKLQSSEIKRFSFYSPHKFQIYEKDFIPLFLDNLIPMFHLTHLKFYSTPNYLQSPHDDQFFPWIDLSKLPQALVYLEFADHFDQPLSYPLPPNLLHLVFGTSFDQPLDVFPLPSKLISLTLGHLYNQSLPSLPSNLKHITFGQLFDRLIDNLPSNLQTISMHYKLRSLFMHRFYNNVIGFNQKIDLIPSTITHLQLGINYNQPILHPLPPNLTHLEFVGSFNQPLPRLPITLKYLALSENFNQTITSLPPNLTHLIFSQYGSRYEQPLYDLPTSITHLILSHMFNLPLIHYPPNLTHLVYGNNFNHPVDNYLPQQLTHIKFGYYFNFPVEHLPHSITHLIFNDYFNHPVNCLPPNLVFLKFGESGSRFNQSVDHLPHTITHLYFGFYFNHQVNSLPPNLTHLFFGNNFNNCVDRLPKSIEYIKFSHSFQQSIDALPHNIVQLTLHVNYLLNIANFQACHPHTKIVIEPLDADHDVDTRRFMLDVKPSWTKNYATFFE